jgi:hypothetical protein
MALVGMFAVEAAAQRASDFRWSGAVAAGNEVAVNNINGDVKVFPSTTGRVEVLGIKEGDARYYDRIKVDVQQTSRGIVICVLFEDNNSYCDERGMHSNGRNNNNRDREWDHLAVNLEVAVPANLRVNASSVSGDVDVTGAQGDVSASSVSGDVTLNKLRASSIRANSVSGDIVVRVDQFIGQGDLSFNTVSGDVILEVPRQFDADLSMTTVSGDINSDFEMVIGGNGRNRRNIDARIGSGGRRLDLNTVSGDLRIKMIN